VKWYRQKQLATLHFRRQPEDSVSEIDASKEHTYVYEWVTESDNVLLTEDGLSYFVSDESIADYWDFGTEDGNATPYRWGLPIDDGLRHTRAYLETEDGIELSLMYEEGYLFTEEQSTARFINEKRND